MPGLAVTHLRLSHFRSHKALSLDVGEGPVAIFGANGAGKTNLIEAVSLLSPGRGFRRASMQDLTRRPEAIGWKIAAHLTHQDQQHEVQLWSEEGGARKTMIDGKAAPQTALGRLCRVLWLVPSMDRLWTEGAEGRRRFLDRITLSFEPAHAVATLAYEKAMRDRNRLLRDQVTDAHWYRALEAQMAEHGAQIVQNRLQALEFLAQAPGQTVFPAAELALDWQQTPAFDGATELGDLLAAARPRDMAAGRSLVGPHRQDLSAHYAAKAMPARDCSTGEQKALLISLVLANARALRAQIGVAPILLLDEIAAHLDADRRAALYREIDALGAQAWMTGTGPELFADLPGAAQKIEVSESVGISAVDVL